MVSVNRRNYERLDFPYFAKPAEVGSFSLDASATQHHNRSQLKYLRLPTPNRSVCFDLNDGFEKFVDKKAGVDLRDAASRTYLQEILTWISTQQPATPLKEAVFGANFVCFRGCLTRLCASPYENREGWKFALVRYNDVIFICEFQTEEKIKEEMSRNDFQKKMVYWGWKFEQYVVTDSKSQARPDTSKPVKNQEQFASVVRSKLGRHRLLFSGEVDCVENDGKYVEIKTNRMFSNDKQRQNFHRFKTVKWWLQSFLIGIDKIVCGFRDDNGIVVGVKEMQLNDIYRNSEKFWKPSVCLNFLNNLFDFLQSKITANDSSKIYLISWRPGWDTVSFDLLSDADAQEYKFMPDWFLESYPQ